MLVSPREEGYSASFTGLPEFPLAGCFERPAVKQRFRYGLRCVDDFVVHWKLLCFLFGAIHRGKIQA